MKLNHTRAGLHLTYATNGSENRFAATKCEGANLSPKPGKKASTVYVSEHVIANNSSVNR